MLLKLYTDTNVYEDLQQVVDTLNDGGLVIFPTDCRYVIGCHALKTHSVEKICRLKGIDPMRNRLSIICYDLSTISEYAKLDTGTFKLIKKNVPGPFTFILPGSNRLPKMFFNRKEVGVRMPDNNITMEVARLLEVPIVAASLPVPEDEDEDYFTNPELIDEMFGDVVDLVIDGGTGQNALSTVVDCTKTPAEIVRQGAGNLKF